MSTNFPRPRFTIPIGDNLVRPTRQSSDQITVETQRTMILYVEYGQGSEDLADLFMYGLFESGGTRFPTSGWLIMYDSGARIYQLDVASFRSVVIVQCGEGDDSSPGTMNVTAVLSRAAPHDPLFGRQAAARDGRDLSGFVNDTDGITANTVLTDPGLVYNLKDDERVFIDKIQWGMITPNETLHVEFGYTTGVDGTGTFIPLTMHRHVITPVPSAGFGDRDEDYQNLRAISYARGARSITFRATASSTDAEISVGWYGWREKER